MRALALSLVVLLIPLAGVGGTSSAETPGHPAAAAADSRPNIVLILTDDMRFGDRDRMPSTTRLLRRFRMTQFLSNHPMCCPARAQLITGQYAHRNGVFHNKGPFGSDRALRKKNNTLAAWLYDAGYSTGLSGKWLNEWAPGLGSKRPYGWTHFNAWIGEVYSPFAYTSYNDGRPVQPRVHTNDAVTRSAVRHIKEFGDGPFFVYASYISPHAMFVNGKWGPPVPAPRHAGLFAGAKPSYQRKPSFDYGPEMTRSYQHSWRQRIRSLQSVDEGVRDIIGALRSTGELRNTVVIFTSDNGMLLGEHRHHGKNVPWEEALRVPCTPGDRVCPRG